MDPQGHRLVDLQEIWNPLERQFGGPSSGTAGHHGPEAVVEGLSAGPGARAQVGSRGISRDRKGSQADESGDLGSVNFVV